MTDLCIPIAVAAVSNITLALLGVDYYSVLWGFVGALLAVMEAEREPWLRAVLLVSLSTLVGAALGTGTQALLEHPSRALLIIGSIVGGAGAKLIVSALLGVAVRRINGLASQLPREPETEQEQEGGKK